MLKFFKQLLLLLVVAISCLSLHRCSNSDQTAINKFAPNSNQSYLLRSDSSNQADFYFLIEPSDTGDVTYALLTKTGFEKIENLPTTLGDLTTTLLTLQSSNNQLGDDVERLETINIATLQQKVDSLCEEGAKKDSLIMDLFAKFDSLKTAVDSLPSGGGIINNEQPISVNPYWLYGSGNTAAINTFALSNNSSNTELVNLVATTQEGAQVTDFNLANLGSINGNSYRQYIKNYIYDGEITYTGTVAKGSFQTKIKKAGNSISRVFAYNLNDINASTGITGAIPYTLRFSSSDVNYNQLFYQLDGGAEVATGTGSIATEFTINAPALVRMIAKNSAGDDIYQEVLIK